MLYKHAITRKPGRNFAAGLTTAKNEQPDYELIIVQHNDYVEVLRSLGVEVIVLDPLPEYPDSYFVEDTAVVFPEAAVITNPGAESRRGEEDGIELVLARFRDTAVRISSPGTVDGGDVLQAEKHFFIGISERTNEEGARQLGKILQNYGYSWEKINVGDGLHLKSGVNYLGNNTMLLSEGFNPDRAFSGYNRMVLDKDEEYAGNTLLVNGFLLVPAGFPKTIKKLKKTGFKIIELNVSEVRKMDGGLTCMSLRF